MKLLLIIVFVWFTIDCTAQLYPFKGKVRSVYENNYKAADSAGYAVKFVERYTWSYYFFNANGKETVEANNHAGNEFIKKEVYKYDSKGREIADYSYITDTVNYPSASLTRYNWRGRIIEHDLYFHYTPGWSETHPSYADKIRYTYTFSGKIKDKIDIHFPEYGNDSSVTKYDYQKNIIHIKGDRIDTTNKYKDSYLITYYCNYKDTCEATVLSGQITQRVSNKYDNSGHLVIKISKGIKDNSFNKREYYTYNKRGQQTEYIRYENDTIPDYKIINTYDKGSKILLNQSYECNQYNGDKLTECSKAIYQYDTIGNLVKEVIYSNGRPTVIIERIITYYK